MSLLRRIALVSVALIGIVCALGFTVSYLGNRELLSKAEVVKDQSDWHVHPEINRHRYGQLQLLEQRVNCWTTLKPTRQVQRRSLGLRWGLYIKATTSIQTVCSAYSRDLNQLILDGTRSSMAERLRQLSYRPGGAANAATEDNQAFNDAYSTLKTYLVITSESRSMQGLNIRLASDVYAYWPAS